MLATCVERASDPNNDVRLIFVGYYLLSRDRTLEQQPVRIARRIVAYPVDIAKTLVLEHKPLSLEYSPSVVWPDHLGGAGCRRCECAQQRR